MELIAKWFLFICKILFVAFILLNILVIGFKWPTLPNRIPIHLENNNNKASKLIIFLPLVLSCLNWAIFELYRRKKDSSKVSDLFLQYALSFYFIYISFFYLVWLLYGPSMLFNKIVLSVLVVLIIIVLFILELRSKLRLK